MMRYYFHATDGYSAVFDTTGLRLGSMDLVVAAAQAAHEVRRRFGMLADLTDWLIVVQDDFGQEVATLDFAELPDVTPFEALAA